MTEIEKLGYDLSCYAAASKQENTLEFLEGLFEMIEKYQNLYKETAMPTESKKECWTKVSEGVQDERRGLITLSVGIAYGSELIVITQTIKDSHEGYKLADKRVIQIISSLNHELSAKEC